MLSQPKHTQTVNNCIFKSTPKMSFGCTLSLSLRARLQFFGTLCAIATGVGREQSVMKRVKKGKKKSKLEK